MVLPKNDEQFSTFDKLSEEEMEQEYSQNLANGKKNLLCGDFPEAVTCFQNACYLRSEQFGDTSHECAEAFFCYGKALLELARMENTVLGNALKGVPETEESDSEADSQFEKTKNIPVEEREQLRHDVEAAMATEEDESMEEQETSDEAKTTEEEGTGSVSDANQEKEQVTSDEHIEEKKTGEETETSNTDIKQTLSDNDTREAAACTLVDQSETDSKPSEEEQKEGNAPAEGESSSSEPSTSTGITGDAKPSSTEEEIAQEDPDDISNMQLAWEMLELAKVLYSKKPESEKNSLLIARCHSMLGELGLEVENYTQSIGDFNECLKIYEKVVANSDRKLAEIHYNLGLAYYFVKEYDSSLKHYRSANQVLERRIDFLDEKIDAKGDKNDAEVMDECSEIGEIKNLIPDINSKIEDVILMKRRETRLSELGECSSTGFSAASSSFPLQSKQLVEQGAAASPSGQATNDISHLVRRKRPNAEPEETDEATSESVPLCKKMKEDAASDAKTAPETSKVDESEKENVNVATETAV